METSQQLLLKNHLTQLKADSLDSEDPKKLLQKYRAKSTINPSELRTAVYGRFVPLREQIFNIMISNPIYKQYTVTESTRKEMRATSLRWIKYFFSKFERLSYEGYKKDPSIFHMLMNVFYEFDASLSVKCGVHFNLYTKTIINLGTEKHRPYIDRAIVLEDIGCFGLTELGHGSNARGILTRADYDIKTKEFVINTPVDIAMKFWIGAAAHLANMCVVMAQLYINDKNYGVHGFIVPIRTEKDHTLMPGVLAGDCGSKVGVNAIDNGFLLFNNVHIPYDNLLDKFSSITPEGKFKSSIKSADKRFGLSLGGLSGGRIQFIDGANTLLRNALTIAIRFAACRRQFGAPGQPETNILEYPLTQYRLMPYLAESFVMSIAAHDLVETWCASQGEIFQENNPVLNEIHSLSSTLKPLATWLGQRGIQECREVCGGLGYSAYNRLGQLREDNDVNTTWEGDNNVLLQQTSKFLMDCLRNLKAGNQLPYPSLAFLQEEFSIGEATFIKDQRSLQKAFEVRANFLIHSSFDQLAKNMMSSDNTLQAWNDSHVFFLKDASIAYAETYILREFFKGLERAKDENTRKILRKLGELYGYQKLEQNASAFLEIGYFTKSDLDTVREKVKELCKEVKDEAVGLIDAIALPDELLNSPIGAYDGDIYNRFINVVWSAPGAFGKPDYWREIRNSKL